MRARGKADATVPAFTFFNFGGERTDGFGGGKKKNERNRILADNLDFGESHANPGGLNFKTFYSRN